ncbi:metal ABC transporter permease [Thiohalocapsa halophila]
MIGELGIAPFVEFGFMRRALVGCLALSLGATPVGVFLMLRRMSLTGDAMAHAILPGAALGYLLWGLSLGALTLGGLAAGLAVALLAGAVARGGVLGEDASLAAFYLISLALGVLLISLKGSQVDLFHVLFGSVLALDNATLILIAGITSLTLLALALLFRPLVAECVDPAFLRAVSRTSAPVHFVFLALVVLNLVAGFQALGTLLAVGMAILPAAAARFWVRDIGALLALAVALAFLGSTLGLLGSYHLGLAAGPAIVLAIGALYLASLLAAPRGLILAWLLSRRHLTG